VARLSAGARAPGAWRGLSVASAKHGDAPGKAALGRRLRDQLKRQTGQPKLLRLPPTAASAVAGAD